MRAVMTARNPLNSFFAEVQSWDIPQEYKNSVFEMLRVCWKCDKEKQAIVWTHRLENPLEGVKT